MDAATAELDPPFGALNLAALRYNAHDMVRRAGGVPIRVATKSIRIRGLIDSLLAVDGYAGVLAFTLPEAIWLSDLVDDIVVGYPTADRGAIRELAGDERLARTITIMVDSVEHLDFIDACVPPDRRESIRVCLELDVSWRGPAPIGFVGVQRSPLRTAAQVAALARDVVRRPGFTLVGLMGYEAQIAGLADDIPSRATWSAFLRWVQRRSMEELVERRGEVVRVVSDIVPLEFVNGGGTGSLERTGKDPSVTEIAAGSGILAGHLFDHYASFTPMPAAAFALPVVRKPSDDVATLLGGGWVASGPPGDDRMPLPVWPTGLAMEPREMAGEVQTPLRGEAARWLRVGDRVWLRHAKSGELATRVNSFHVVDDDRVVDELPTYHGEGKAFL